MNKAIFLDRDGTLIKDKGYQFDVSSIKFLPGVIYALKKFQLSGFKLIVITNQSGIGRGLFSEDDMKEYNNKICNELKKNSIKLSKIYYCPHFLGSDNILYNKKCYCRKPLPGLIFDAAHDFNIDLSKSFMIGDKPSDVLAGINANVRNSFLIDKKYSLLYYAKLICDNDVVL